MRLRWVCVIVVACGGIGLQFCLNVPAAKADGAEETTGTATAEAACQYEDAGEQACRQCHDYVGSRACKKCHLTQYKSWAKTAMGRALETLKPGKAVAAKKKHGLDPARDYSTDEACLKCHVVGFGLDGGYVIPTRENLDLPADADAATVTKALKQAVKDAESRTGVGCESCHGPGEDYVKLFQEIMTSKRKYKVQELYDAGLTKPDETQCVHCHNDKSPTHDPRRYTYTDADGKEQTTGFHYEQAKDKDIHKHKPLKLRDDD